MNGEEFLTVKEMAEKLGITPNTAKHRLFQLGIKPLSTDALYDKAAMEAIRNVPGKGRPKKAAESDAAKPAPAKSHTKESEK